MFRLFRKREVLKKYLLIFFLGVVSIGMVITLAPLPSGNSLGRQTNVIAEIGGQTITTQDLDRNIRQRLQNMTGKYSPQLASAVAGPILDDMIIQRALSLQAGKLGLQVTDAEVLRAARAIPGLYPDGKFIGDDRFEQAMGMTVNQFLEQLRQNLLVQKIRSVVTDGVSVTPAEVHQEFLRRNAKVKVEYVVFDPSKLLKDVDVTPQALQDFYQKDPERYKVPEERQVRYVLITPDRLRAEVKVSDADLQQYYTQHLSDYRVPDRVKVEHILFKTTGKTPDEIKTIEKTAQDVLVQIKAGKSFEDLARQYSEDSSASQGGMIGWITHGQTVKEFEDTAFSLEPGQVSGLIKTTYGIHIIKVLDKQKAHLETFDEVKNDIRATLEKQKLADAQQSFAQNLENQFKADPQHFSAVASKAGLEAKESPLFRYHQVIPDFGNSDSFANLAFQLRPGEIGQPITVPKGTAIIQLVESVPPRVQALDQIRAQVEEDYRAAQSKVLAQQRAKEFASKAASGDFKAVARSLGVEVKESKDFTQRDYLGDLGPVSDLAGAFTLAPGKTSDAVNVNGNQIVFRVASRTPANEADFAAQKDQLAEQLLQQKRQLAFELYREDLKERFLKSGELKMNEGTLKQFLASYQRS
jgi:peptidyl-prolyl cis-trans isomerase D